MAARRGGGGGPAAAAVLQSEESRLNEVVQRQRIGKEKEGHGGVGAARRGGGPATVVAWLGETMRTSSRSRVPLLFFFL
ncbi:hypothetical protein DAI22_12g071800 [Oryza sativa Japonica Group]|nr:hypothetical protein DAI22_12g071800 [Oryza sativa Japonica Group]